MTEKHTPTPWKVQPHDGWMANKLPPIEILGADGRVVACNTSYYPTPISEANAAFIVKAVNSHTALVEALTAIHRRAVAFKPELDSYDDMRRDLRHIEATAARALAGEKDAPKDVVRP